jgi:hypothetical protein
MNGQIFIKKIKNEIIYNILEKICTKNNNLFIVNKDSFKRGLFTNDISNFLEELKPYYHKKKQFYLERKMTYNFFVTILRQFCNFKKIPYTSEIKYDKSKYEIVYNIIFVEDEQ